MRSILRLTTLMLGLMLISVVAQAAGPYQYYPLTPPCRVADTRSGAAIPGGTYRLFRVHASCGVPTSAKVAALNYIVLAPSGTLAAGHLVAWGAGLAAPGVSTANWSAGETAIANSALTELTTTDVNGNNISVSSPVSFHLIIDVSGYYQ